jgi:hypothetical protein
LKKKIGVGSLGAVNETSTFTTKLVCYLFAWCCSTLLTERYDRIK